MRPDEEIERQLEALAEGASNDAEIERLREVVGELLEDRQTLRSELAWAKGVSVFDVDDEEVRVANGENLGGDRG